MYAESTSIITITEPSKEIITWCREKLTLDNPDYLSAVKTGRRTWGIEKTIRLYVTTPDSIKVPSGCASMLRDMGVPIHRMDYIRHPAEYDTSKCTLYDHQTDAVCDLLASSNGILTAPCGTGKTIMMLSAIGMLGVRTLWIAHTDNLVKQAMDEAICLYGKDGMSRLKSEKIMVGRNISFATVQMLNKMDLSKICNEWDAVVVDECHHVAGGVVSTRMYAHVLNSLNALIKWGCTATDYRQDGLTFSMFAMLGPVVADVPDEKANLNRVPAIYNIIKTDWMLDVSKCKNSYGNLQECKAKDQMIADDRRNQLIIDTILSCEKPCLVLSGRLKHLDYLCEVCPGIKVKEHKENIENDILYATYSLLSEGYDNPNLRSLILATPIKDKRTFVQSVGRVQRIAPGKEYGTVYDISDNCLIYDKWSESRKNYAKKEGLL